ncbi:hypothetical protein BDR03DRAFT_981012 [Suillus americanus]|nr:hypothetical protein BDR03DRAFT_981012 [Suillus americanus]
MALTLTIDDSDDELEIPAEFCAPFTQHSPVGLSKASFAVGSLKRKASEDLDLTLESEIEDFSDDAINNKMDIDLLDKSDLTYGVKSEKPPHTTSSTSVMTTDIKPALTKKAKVLSMTLGATPAKPKEQQSLNIVFQAVYPELNLAIVQNRAVFLLWRSNFGSTAIAIIFNFLTSNNDCDPEVLAGLLLKNFAFIFEDMDKCEPDGAFRSAFMLQLLGKAHLSAVNGHAIIPTLKTKDLASKGMAGVIAFCATALEHAVTLISEGNIKVENILASTPSRSKLNIKLPKVLNKVTGKETSAPYLFSRNLWGKANTGYMKSIKKKPQ